MPDDNQHETVFDEEVMEHLAPAVPVDVRIVEDVSTEPEAAELNSFQSYLLAGTEAPFRLLAFAQRRKKAMVTISPGAAGNAAGVVWLGTQEQVQNLRGGRYVSGNTITIESQREVWLSPDGTNSLYITVLEERYS